MYWSDIIRSPLVVNVKSAEGLATCPLPPPLCATARSQVNVSVGIGSRGTDMKIFPLIMLLQLVSYVSVSGPAERSPDSVVRELYQQVVARRPLGIPWGADKAAVRPFLSKKLIQRLDVAQTCEDDYFRQHTDKDSKPAFAWLETGLFSGANEEAIPSAAVVERTELQKDRSFHVYVQLTYKESFETYGRPPDPANTFNWHVVAVAISDGGRFVVDDILLFKDDSKKIASRLADSFPGCDGSHWVGDKMRGR
jgi:hypothetical protein